MPHFVYLALKESVQVEDDCVKICDVADIYTKNGALTEQLKNIRLFEQDENEKRQIVTALFLIQRITDFCEEALVMTNGETDCIVERKEEMNCGGNVPKTKAAGKSGKEPGTKDMSKSEEALKTKPVKTQKTGTAKAILPWLKVALVCLLCMFGGAFSIMAFHNDISITDFFQGFYESVMGMPSDGFTILEVSYSVGLMAGIVLFYNHIGKRRISKDPTPIEVSMRSYEKEMNEAMVASWEREGKKIDVD